MVFMGGGSKIEKKRKQTMSLMTALLAKLKSPFLDSSPAGEIP